MKQVQWRKFLAWNMAALALVAAMTACSGSGGENESPSPSADVPGREATSQTEGASESSPSPAASEILTESGEYVGMMDGHSIEIIVKGQAMPFQIDAETADKVSTWEEGTPVKFQYEVYSIDIEGQQVKQNVVKVIDKA